MLKRIISSVFLPVYFSTSVFAHTASIQINGHNKYKAVRLTPEIYNNANSDLSDILIKDSKGETVPYFINTGLQNGYEHNETYSMELINSYTKENDFYFDYKLSAMRESDTVATSLEFSTSNTDFVKIIDVYGSYDNLHWDFVQNDKLYDVDDKSKLEISFNKPQKYTHYRLKLGNNDEKIAFEAVNLVYSINSGEKNYFTERFNPEFNIEQRDKKTLIKIVGLKHLRLSEVTIETDSMFKRMANAPLVTGKEIYNLTFNNTTYTDTTISLDWQIPKDDIYVITINDNDDKPINIKGITVLYYSEEIVFEGNTSQNYTLSFGEDATKTPPVYDITSYKEEILKTAIDKAAIGAIIYDAEQENRENPNEKNYQIVFNIVVIGTTVLLGGLIIYRLKRK